jgi:hypothetical protein
MVDNSLTSTGIVPVAETPILLKSEFTGPAADGGISLFLRHQNDIPGGGP